jgi:lipopolysaccharide/colanic/teichoic acid biosynthesis glycosyltransferase
MYQFFKRICDFTVSFIALIILIPFLVIIMLILRFVAEGEVFYYQERMGFKNKKFFIVKFATMLKDSLNLGTGSITLENDFRVTSFGKILRKTKVNELPQLLNILKGDISVIGPRPVLEQDWLLYPDTMRDNIYRIKPGLTGIGSIVFRDEESLISNIEGEDYHEFYKNSIAPYKAELEIWYQENISFYTDIKLIILTALVLFFPNNQLHQSWFSNLPFRKF